MPEVKINKPHRKWTVLHTLQAQYENFVTLTVSRPTAVRYCKALEDFFSRFPDRSRPEEFTRRDVEDYRVIRLRDGITPRTINFTLGAVRSFWNWMTDMEVASWNPASQVKRLKEKEPAKKSLSIADQLQLQKGCFSWGDQALVALALTTGLRGETLAALLKSEVDFEQGRLVIPPEKMKTARSHETPLPEWVLDILKDSPEGRIFDGYARNANSIRYHWNCICRRAGVEPNGIRSARRSFATTLVRSGVDLGIVKDLMGHKNILTTSRYLTPADSATTRDAINRLPDPSKELK